MNDSVGRLAVGAAVVIGASLSVPTVVAAQEAASGSPAARAGAEPAPRSAAARVMSPAVSVAVGPLLVMRSLEMRADSQTTTHQPGSYIGGTVQLAVRLVDFDSFDGSLRLEGRGGYAASSNTQPASELNRAPITEWSTLDMRLTVRRLLSEAVAVDVGLGGYANSFVVEPNRTYTGHRYLAADIHAALHWKKPAAPWALQADLSAYPVLDVDESHGVHTSAAGFGGRLGVQLGYEIAALSAPGESTGGRVGLRYEFTRLRTQFPESRITLDGGVSQDDMHSITLLLGYYL